MIADFCEKLISSTIVNKYDSFGRIDEAWQELDGARSAEHDYIYDATTLVLDQEVITYNPGLTNEVSRTIDRSYETGSGDTINLRPNGYQLLNDTVVQQDVSYTYDDIGRLETVSDLTDTFTYNYVDYAPSLLESLTAPAHKVVNTYEPDRNVLDTKTNQYLDESTISRYDYIVNEIGQRTDVARDGAAFASSTAIILDYDDYGQLTSANYPGSALDESYDYDAIGNRSSSTVPVETSGAGIATNSYTPNSLNQMAQVNGINQTFDDDGNLKQSADGITLTWNAENRMISSTKGGVTTSYRYDYLGRSIAKSTPSDTTYYIYDGWNPIAELSTTVDYCLWGQDLSGSLQGAGGVGGLLSITKASGAETATSYPTYDGNGNVSEYVEATTASLTTIVAHYEYDSFGNTTKATGAKAYDFAHRFSTKPIEDETGFYYYGYRYYNPVTGTWPNRDPIEEMGGMNVYAFVGNYPIGSVDVLGRASFSDCTKHTLSLPNLQWSIPKLFGFKSEVRFKVGGVKKFANVVMEKKVNT